MKITYNTPLIKKLNIKFIKIHKNTVIAKMPVVHQINGLMHGGVSVVLAETVGGVLSTNNIQNNEISMCIEISANHLKYTKNGYIIANSNIIHKGKTLHFINVSIEDNKQQIISICKMTNIILLKNKLK